MGPSRAATLWSIIRDGAAFLLVLVAFGAANLLHFIFLERPLLDPAGTATVEGRVTSREAGEVGGPEFPALLKETGYTWEVDGRQFSDTSLYDEVYDIYSEGDPIPLVYVINDPGMAKPAVVVQRQDTRSVWIGVACIALAIAWVVVLFVRERRQLRRILATLRR